MVTINRVSNLQELVSTAASRFVDAVAAIQSSGGGCHHDGIARVVLTGGGAGIGMLEELRRLDQAANDQGEDFPALRVDWQRIQIFFGDERNVAVTDSDSNEGQARKALLDHVDIPNDHIHGYELGTTDMEDAAQKYTEELRRFAPEGIDLYLLGMGGEGHINSLFPHTAAVREKEATVVTVYDSPKPPAERISLTLPTFAKAKRVWFLVAGEEKAEAAAHVVAGAKAEDWPAAGAHGIDETVLFIADNAATQLPRG